MSRYALLLAVLLLVGCATPPAEVIYQPVAVPCLGEMPTRPTAAPGPYPGYAEAVRALARELARWEQYAEQVGVAVAGCATLSTR